MNYAQFQIKMLFKEVMSVHFSFVAGASVQQHTDYNYTFSDNVTFIIHENEE